MLSKKKKSSMELFQMRLTNLCSHDHPLYKLAGQIDWSAFESAFGASYCPDNGRAAKPIRLLVGLHYLKHAFNESDESVVARWVENPYWQYFCGMEYFSHELPCHPTLLVKWRHRVGAEKLEKLLAQTVDCARREKLIVKKDLAFVNVDTTVQEKNIAFPTDARLYQKGRLLLVKIAKRRGIRLHQTFEKEAKETLIKQHRFCATRKFKKAKKMTSKLKTFLGRVIRDIERKADPMDREMREALALANRLLGQRRNSKNKIYSLHEPQVQCIAKGKAHKKYEFGNKVAVVTTSETNWIVGVQGFGGNPYDGHTLEESIEAMGRLTGQTPVSAYCDKGYRGKKRIGETAVHVAGYGRRDKTCLDRFLTKRRSSIEPTIGHLKSDNRLGRNYLAGEIGDRINPILAAAGYNMRKLLKAFFCPILVRLRETIFGWNPVKITDGSEA